VVEATKERERGGERKTKIMASEELCGFLKIQITNNNNDHIDNSNYISISNKT